MMRPHIVLRYIGLVLLFNSLFLFISAVISALNNDSALSALLYSGTVSTLFGLFPIIFVPAAADISKDEGLLIVIASWLLCCVIGSLPYILWDGAFSFTDAWFESVSGFTTTGSSIINNIEALPMGLLFWRASTHWIGGIGIIIFMLALLPAIGRATMILYQTEIAPLAKDNFQYRTKKSLQILLVVYIGLTILETLALWACKMSLFDAVTHAFATIATGGFSTKNTSIAYFNSLAVESVIMVFMVLSGMHFGLLFLAVTGNLRKAVKSAVLRYYLAALGVGWILITLDIRFRMDLGWGQALRQGGFQLLSLGTSTGFASADSNPWPGLAKLVLIFFSLQCACSGSTSGGIKTDRLFIFLKSLTIQFRKLRHPKAVIIMKIDDNTIDQEIVQSSNLYLVSYLAVVFLTTLILTGLGVDLMSAFSAAVATTGNVGPGFGMVSSLGNFSQISDLGKWTLSFSMLIGRLEIYSFFLFLTYRFRSR